MKYLHFFFQLHLYKMNKQNIIFPTDEGGDAKYHAEYLGIWQEMDRDIGRMFAARCAGAYLCGGFD